MDQQKVLDGLQTVIDGVKPKPNPADPVENAGTAPNSAGVAYIAPVVDEATLGKVESLIQAAKTSKPDFDKILGVLVEVFKKLGLPIAVVLLFALSGIGCSQNPANVRDGHLLEWNALDAYHENVRRNREALLADLREAFKVQAQFFEERELAKAKDTTPDSIQKILKDRRDLEAKGEETLGKVAARWSEVDQNWYIAKRIHDAIQRYLERESDTSQSELSQSLLDSGRILREISPESSPKP